MPKVFISHAAADKRLVDDLHAMVQGAIGLQPGKELSYSSGAGTGVLAGKNFVQYIRDEMDGSTFVIAVITPSFLQSAFCLAELGAVWLAADAKSFFPICVPSVDRGELSATLTGIHVERLDDRPALAQLLQRVSEHFGRDYNAAAGDAQITAFQASLPTRLRTLATPKVVPAAELEAAKATIETLGRQLVEARDEAAQEKTRADEILAARTLEEAQERAQALPDDTTKALDELVKAARGAIREIPSVVADALPYDLKGEDMPWPDRGDYDHGEVRRQVDDGLLRDNEDGTVSLDKSFPAVSTAAEAVEDLQNFLRRMGIDEQEWFTNKYDVPPDLRKGKAFRDLLR